MREVLIYACHVASVMLPLALENVDGKGTQVWEDYSHHSCLSILLNDLGSRGVLFSAFHPPPCPELPKIHGTAFASPEVAFLLAPITANILKFLPTLKA